MPVAPEHAAGGPYFFAWANATDEFGETFHRYDDYVFSFSLKQSEGDFATLEVELKNPMIGGLAIGLIAPGRQRYVWFAKQRDATIEPLFFGRVVGVPSDLNDETIRMTFTARPIDVAAQKRDVADGLRVLPHYDPVFVDDDHVDDPEVVLEGYSALWHFDRVSHEVSISDYLVGEDGVETFEQSQALYDSLKVELSGTPLQKVTVTGSVTWTQQATGGINIGTFGFFGGAVGSAWPKPGSALQGGWSVAQSSTSTNTPPSPKTFNLSWTNREKEHQDGDTMSYNESFSGFDKPGPGDTHYTEFVIGDPNTGTAFRSRIEAHMARPWFPGSQCSLSMGYNAKRKRNEKIILEITSDLQNIILEDDEEPETETIEASGRDVGLPVEDVSSDSVDSDDTEIPLTDLSRRSYLPTDRGLLSLEHLILRGVARLKLGARIAKATFETTIDRGIDITLRKNALLYDYRLPGGQAIGKIIEYELHGNGDSGEFLTSIIAGCTIGLGNSITISEGDPIYVDDDYVESDYQERDGEIIAVGDGAVGYSLPVDAANDDGIVFPLSSSQAIVALATHRGVLPAADLRLAFQNTNTTPPDPFGAFFSGRLNEIIDVTAAAQLKVQTTAGDWFELELINLTGGPFDSEFAVTTTPLVLPMQINLTTS